MFDKIPSSLLPTTSPSQEAFITKYIDKSYKKKKAAKQAMLESAWLTYQSSRGTCSEIVDQVNAVARSKEDYDFVSGMRVKCADAIAKIKPGRFKGLSDATKQIVEVAEDLVELKKEALAYMRSQASSGRDLGEEAKIKLIISAKRAEALEIKSEFDTEAEKLRAKVRAEAPKVAWDPEQVGQFAKAFIDCSNELDAIPRIGDLASSEGAQKTADASVAKLDKAKTDLLAPMDEFANGDTFSMFVADMRRRDAVLVALEEARATLDQLNRWGAPEAKKIASDAVAIEKEIEHVFKDRSGLSESDAKAAEEAQDTLLGKAVSLGREAKSAVTNTESAFGTEIDALRPQVEKLEQRWTACKGNVGKRQTAPIVAQMTAMRVALDGLGGCNPSAVDAVKRMIKASTDLIVQAEHIEELNARIVSTLDEADGLAKGLTGSDNPIAGDFATHRTEIKEMKAGYKEKAINDATKEADEKLAAVKKDAERNQELIKRKAEIRARIAKREEQLEGFNELFREMQKKVHPDFDESKIKDYRGSFAADIETCKSWVNTKTDPAFYDTIDAKLDSILTEMDKEAGNLRVFLSKDYNQLMLDAAAAAVKHRDAMADLNKEDGAALAKLTKAQEDLAAMNAKAKEGETIDPEAKKAAEDALAAANKERGDIADKRAEVQKEYDDATHLLDRQRELDQELARAEAADALAARKREEFLEVAKAWLSDVKSEVKNKDEVLSDYSDEAKPQIERVENSRSMLKKNEKGVTGESAFSELNFVKDFLQRLRDRGRKTDKKQLGDIGTQWDREVGKINASATSLITAIEEFEKFPSVEGTASKDVEKMFGIILGRMLDHKFEHAAKTFNDSEDKQVRKAAREEALSEVRRYRALMFNDPLLQKCVMNPFGVPVGSSTANRLDEIELNVLRGI
ncbi:MAG: hypothetical protein AB3N23_19455 [Paracoccaceae bacterium]